MPKVRLSTGARSLAIVELLITTFENIKENNISTRLRFLGRKINSISSFVNGYSLTEDESLNTDDEILNWTMVDVIDDLSASIWNLGTGFYKTSASCQRGAIEMAAVSLFFQRLENENSISSGYNDTFSSWDNGDISTPNWGKIKPYLKNHQLIGKFENENDFCVIDEAYNCFKYLCSFTHSRAFSPEDGKGTNSINMQNIVGEYSEVEFKRLAESLDETIANIASIWAVTYPHTVAEWTYNSNDIEFVDLDEIFSTHNSKKTLIFARENK